MDKKINEKEFAMQMREEAYRQNKETLQISFSYWMQIADIIEKSFEVENAMNDISNATAFLSTIKNEILNLNKTHVRRSGFMCPKCGNTESSVTNSRKNNGFLVRQRKCLSCDCSWKTEEILRSQVRKRK